MVNVRRNVFETNSSSMHSLVITKQARKYTDKELALGYDPEYHKTFDLWGWKDEDDMYYERSPFQILSTPLEKLQYYCAYTLGTWRDKPAKKDIDRIKKFIMRQTGIDDPTKIFLYRVDRWDKEEGKNKYYGAVVSNDTGEDPMAFVKRKGIDWEDLILNPKYIIIVDGDEIQNFKELVETRIINTDNFEDISSGVDFWNDANIRIYVNWLRKSEPTDEDYVEDIDDKTKTVDFIITEPNRVKICNDIIDRVKSIIKLMKEAKPEIEARLIVDNWTTEKIDISSIDKSIFDKVIIECERENA